MQNQCNHLSTNNLTHRETCSCFDCRLHTQIQRLQTLKQGTLPTLQDSSSGPVPNSPRPTSSEEDFLLNNNKYRTSSRLPSEVVRQAITPRLKQCNHHKQGSLTERVKQLKKYESMKEIKTQYMTSIRHEEDGIKDMIEQVTFLRTARQSLQQTNLVAVSEAQEEDYSQRYKMLLEREREMQQIVDELTGIKVEHEVEIDTLRIRERELLLQNESNLAKISMLETNEAELQSQIEYLQGLLQKIQQKSRNLTFASEVLRVCLSVDLSDSIKDGCSKHELTVTEAKLEQASKLLAYERKQKERLMQQLQTLEGVRQIEKKKLQFQSDVRLQTQKKVSRQCDSLKSEISRTKADNQKLKDKIDRLKEDNRSMREHLLWIEKTICKQTLTLNLTLQQYYSKVVLPETEEDDEIQSLSESRSSKIISQTDNISSINFDLDDSDLDQRIRLNQYACKVESMEKTIRVRTQKLQDLEVKNLKLENSLKRLEANQECQEQKQLKAQGLGEEVQKLKKELENKQTTIERLRKIMNLKKEEEKKPQKKMLRICTDASASEEDLSDLVEDFQSHVLTEVPSLDLHFDPQGNE